MGAAGQGPTRFPDKDEDDEDRHHCRYYREPEDLSVAAVEKTEEKEGQGGPHDCPQGVHGAVEAEGPRKMARPVDSAMIASRGAVRMPFPIRSTRRAPRTCCQAPARPMIGLLRVETP